MSELGLGLVGYEFMGKACSNVYRQVACYFDVDPVLHRRSLGEASR